MPFALDGLLCGPFGNPQVFGRGLRSANGALESARVDGNASQNCGGLRLATRCRGTTPIAVSPALKNCLDVMPPTVTTLLPSTLTAVTAAPAILSGSSRGTLVHVRRLSVLRTTVDPLLLSTCVQVRMPHTRHVLATHTDTEARPIWSWFKVVTIVSLCSPPRAVCTCRTL